MSLEVVLVGCALVIVISVIVLVNDERVCGFGSSYAIIIVINVIISIAVNVFVNDDHVCGFGSGCALIGAF